MELAFTVEDAPAPLTQRTVRVPPGVTVFDSASWNGIAIDSTCGGHGTCHKCKVRVEGPTPITRHDVRSFSREQLDGGWRLACLVQATRNLAVDVPPLTTRPKAATVGVGRQVILRPAVQKRYVELDEPTLADQHPDLDRLLAAIDDLEPTADLHVLRRLPTVPACGRLQGDRGDRRREPGRRRAGGHDRAAVSRSPSTWARRLWSRRCSTWLGVRRSRVDAQQAAAVRRRRDHPDQRHDDGPRDPATPAQAAAATLSELAAQVCREGGVDLQHVYEVAIAGNATMTALVLGIDPEPLGVAPS